MNQTSKSEAKPAPNPWLKFTIEMGPLLIFFFANSQWGIFVATGVLMAAVVVSMAASLKLTGHIPKMLWVTVVLVLVFGGLTIYFQDETFIKLKPTIIYLLFAGVLGFGLLRGQSYMKIMFEAGFPPMADQGWNMMARNFSLFFLVLAGANEFIWRNFSTDFWVNAKVFGFMGATLVFMFWQVFMLQGHMDFSEEDEDASTRE